MRIQDGPLGHLREVVDQRNAQVLAEISAAAALRSAKGRVTPRSVANSPTRALKAAVPDEGFNPTHVNTVA